MDIEKYERAGRIAQKISFAFEDLYQDESKQKMFYTFFDRYLLPLDPGGRMDPYDAIIALWRINPEEFEQMIMEMKEKKLVPDL